MYIFCSYFYGIISTKSAKSDRMVDHLSPFPKVVIFTLPIFITASSILPKRPRYEFCYNSANIYDTWGIPVPTKNSHSHDMQWNHTYIAVSEFALFIPSTDHRVVHGEVMPVWLIARFTVKQREHCLHQLIRSFTMCCSRRKTSTYTRDTTLQRAYAMAIPSIRPFVPLSDACLISKLLNISSKFFYCLIGPSF